MLTIGKIIGKKHTKLWSIGPEETAYRALEIMAEKDIGSLLVMEKQKLAGIFTERDYSRKVILKGKSSKDTKVKELMTSRVITVRPEHTVDECMAVMKAANCRHMPVFDQGNLVALVTMRDIMNALINEKDIMISDLEHYIHGSEYLDVANIP